MLYFYRIEVQEYGFFDWWPLTTFFHDCKSEGIHKCLHNNMKTKTSNTRYTQTKYWQCGLHLQLAGTFYNYPCSFRKALYLKGCGDQNCLTWVSSDRPSVSSATSIVKSWGDQISAVQFLLLFLANAQSDQLLLV